MQMTTNWNYSEISSATLLQSLGFTVRKRGCPYYVKYCNGVVNVYTVKGDKCINTIIYPLHYCTIKECKGYLLPLLQNGKHKIVLGHPEV